MYVSNGKGIKAKRRASISTGTSFSSVIAKRSFAKQVSKRMKASKNGKAIQRKRLQPTAKRRSLKYKKGPMLTESASRALKSRVHALKSRRATRQHSKAEHATTSPEAPVGETDVESRSSARSSRSGDSSEIITNGGIPQAKPSPQPHHQSRDRSRVSGSLRPSSKGDMGYLDSSGKWGIATGVIEEAFKTESKLWSSFLSTLEELKMDAKSEFKFARTISHDNLQSEGTASSATAYSSSRISRQPQSHSPSTPEILFRSPSRSAQSQYFSSSAASTFFIHDPSKPDAAQQCISCGKHPQHSLTGSTATFSGGQTFPEQFMIHERCVSKTHNGYQDDPGKSISRRLGNEAQMPYDRFRYNSTAISPVLPSNAKIEKNNSLYIPFENLPQYIADVRAYLSHALSGGFPPMNSASRASIVLDRDAKQPPKMAAKIQTEVSETMLPTTVPSTAHTNTAVSLDAKTASGSIDGPSERTKHLKARALPKSYEKVDVESQNIDHHSHLKRFSENAKSKVDDRMDADHLDFEHHKSETKEASNHLKHSKNSDGEAADASEKTDSPHMDHYSHLKRFSEHAKSKVDDHMDADHLDFEHHKPKVKEASNQVKNLKNSDNEASDLKKSTSSAKLALKFSKKMKQLVKPKKGNPASKKSTSSATIVKVVKAKNIFKSLKTKSKTVSESNEMASQVSNTADVVKNTRRTKSKIIAPPLPKVGGTISMKDEQTSIATEEIIEPSAQAQSMSKTIAENERKVGKINCLNDNFLSTLVDGRYYTRDRTRQNVTGKLKVGGWSSIISAALGLEPNAECIDKENAGVDLSLDRNSNLSRQESSLKAGGKASLKLTRQSPARRTQSKLKVDLEPGLRKVESRPHKGRDLQLLSVSARLEKLSKPRHIHEKFTHLKNQEGEDREQPKHRYAGVSKESRAPASSVRQKSTGLSTGEMRTNGLESAHKLSPILEVRSLTPSEIIAMQARLRFHQLRPDITKMLPIEHRVIDALAGYFLARIEDMSKTSNKANLSKVQSKHLSSPRSDVEQYAVDIERIDRIFIQIALDFDGNPVCDAGLVEDYPPKWLDVGICVRAECKDIIIPASMDAPKVGTRVGKGIRKRLVKRSTGQSGKVKKRKTKTKKKKQKTTDQKPEDEAMQTIMASPILVPVHSRTSKVIVPKFLKYDLDYDGRSRVLRAYFDGPCVSRILEELKLYAPIIDEPEIENEQLDENVEKDVQENDVEGQSEIQKPVKLRRKKNRDIKISTNWKTYKN